MVQLRTRCVRLPVPTQRQLDSARKILSSYEEPGKDEVGGLLLPGPLQKLK